MNVQVVKLRDRKERLETGAVRFVLATDEEDWPGLFVRGDEAFVLAQALRFALNPASEPNPIMQLYLRGVLKSYADEIERDVVVKPKEKQDDRA